MFDIMAIHNKVDIYDFIKKSNIKEKLPTIIATIYVAIEDINVNEKSAALTLEEFVDCIPSNKMLKLILYCAQNDIEIMEQCMNEVENIKILKEKNTHECRK